MATPTTKECYKEKDNKYWLKLKIKNRGRTEERDLDSEVKNLGREIRHFHWWQTNL